MLTCVRMRAVPSDTEGCTEFRATLGLERALASRALIELKILRQLCGDCLERGNRVFGLSDRTTYNNMRGTVLESLRGRGNAALVALCAPRGTNARGHDKGIRAKQLAHALGFLRRAHDTREPRLASLHGERAHLLRQSP